MALDHGEDPQMTDKTPINGTGPSHKSTWTDGLPHNFDGWGPKTPDHEDAAAAAGFAHNEWDELVALAKVSEHRAFDIRILHKFLDY